MGLCVALQTESGKQIELVADAKNLLDRLLGSPDARAYPMLASIDRYGDTVFNCLQIDRFLAEWNTLFGIARIPEEEALLKAIQDLAEKTKVRVHHYLVFIGD
jgi:hypothetical protein